MKEIVAGIEYQHPTVVLLQETGIGTSEIAARTCYDSFDASENDCVRSSKDLIEMHASGKTNTLINVNSIEHSDLLDQLAWTHFHHSILEHANLTYLIKGISRAVLQEHARHRIQGISVRSTRYTMSSVLNLFAASTKANEPLVFFTNKIQELDLLTTTAPLYNYIEYQAIFNKLHYQRAKVGTEEFLRSIVAKSSLSVLDTENDPFIVFGLLQSGKKKRNVGDIAKHIVTDNWKVDMVVTMNLRALKNYLDLRSSNSAYFQIQWLANEMARVTPRKYLDLILREDKINKILS